MSRVLKRVDKIVAPYNSLNLHNIRQQKHLLNQ